MHMRNALIFTLCIAMLRTTVTYYSHPTSRGVKDCVYLFGLYDSVRPGLVIFSGHKACGGAPTHPFFQPLLWFVKNKDSRIVNPGRLEPSRPAWIWLKKERCSPFLVDWLDVRGKRRPHDCIHSAMLVRSAARSISSPRSATRPSRIQVKAMGGLFGSLFGTSSQAGPGCQLAPKEAPPGLKLATFAGEPQCPTALRPY